MDLICNWIFDIITYGFNACINIIRVQVHISILDGNLDMQAPNAVQ